jgi:hypothetical protein
MFISSFICENLSFGQTYWNKTYGASNNFILAIQSIVDGNFLAVGSNGAGEGLVIKIKPNGDSIWTKTYGKTSSFNWFSSIQATRDGNFLILGNTTEACLLKINQNGDTLWTKTYNHCVFNAIHASDDGNFLLVGVKNSEFDSPVSDLVVKIKPDGTIIWSKYYSRNHKAEFKSIKPSGDGNFLLAGWTNSNIDSSGFSGWLVKITPNGDSIWSKTFHRSTNSNFYSIQSTNDGNFLLAGSTLHSPNGIEHDGWLVKIRSNGDTIWTRNYNQESNDNFFAIQPASDNNYILIGDRWSGDTVSGLLVKIKPNGDSIWTRTVGKAITTDFRAIKQTCDGNFLVTGFGSISILCIIADQFANKNQLFTYKIPVYGNDTSNFGYTPLKVPLEMKVSAGGTVTWTPKTDSIYTEHAEFLVFNDMGRKDTLTFNIFVNYDYKTQNSARPLQATNPISMPSDITITSISGYVKFNLPPDAGTLYIYDLKGGIVDKITPARTSLVTCLSWPDNQSSRSVIHTGKYFFKAKVGKKSITKLFTLVK